MGGVGLASAIDETLVRRMLAASFPQWAGLPLHPLPRMGWDNRMFRLGRDMVVRMPSAADYASQVEKEQRWLPWLAPRLPLRIPRPLAMGMPSDRYPWSWSIYAWIEGDPASPESILDLRGFALRLAEFLAALRRMDATGGPAPGPHNFHRGGPLQIYDHETREAIDTLKDQLDAEAARTAWDAALATTWSGPPVWIHGDVSAGNLLVTEGRLDAVIDFGMLGVGDPACDLAIAWTLFDEDVRATFREVLAVDDETWSRGRAWALWKALIVAAGRTRTNAVEFVNPWRVVHECLGASEP